MADVYAACTPGIRTVTETVRAGSRPAGALVLGLSDPNQTYQLATGSTLRGDVYLFHSSSLQVSGTVTIAGNIYLVDNSTLQVANANLTIPNDHVTQYRLMATDSASYTVTNSRIALGTTTSTYNRQVMCGQSHATVQNSDFSQTSGSTEAFFAWENATVSTTGNLGNFELSVADAGTVNVTNQHQSPSGHTVVYFAVHSNVPQPIQLASGQIVNQAITFPPDSNGNSMAANIQASDILFALRLDPGAQITMTDSSLALLVTSSGGTTVDGLNAGHIASQTINMGDRSISLINTDVWLWNAYLDGASGPLNLTNSWLGELICTSTGGATCHGQRVVVDGTGGFVSAVGNAQMILDGSILSTYVTAVDQATVTLRSSAVVKPPSTSGQAAPFIQSGQSSLIVLENTAYDPAVALYTSENGAIAIASFSDPGDQATLSRGRVSISGTADVRSATTSPNAWASYSVTATPVGGGSPIRVGQGSSAVQSGALATWNTQSLAAGAYDLHLVVTGRSGVLADVARRVFLN